MLRGESLKLTADEESFLLNQSGTLLQNKKIVNAINIR